MTEDGILHDWKEIENYCDPFKAGDVVDVLLDLNKNYELSYAINGKHFGKAWSVKKDTIYKLAISIQDGKFFLQSHKILY